MVIVIRSIIAVLSFLLRKPICGEEETAVTLKCKSTYFILNIYTYHNGGSLRGYGRSKSAFLAVLTLFMKTRFKSFYFYFTYFYSIIYIFRRYYTL